MVEKFEKNQENLHLQEGQKTPNKAAYAGEKRKERFTELNMQ